jgi:hypothetical protein
MYLFNGIFSSVLAVGSEALGCSLYGFANRSLDGLPRSPTYADRSLSDVLFGRARSEAPAGRGPRASSVGLLLKGASNLPDVGFLSLSNFFRAEESPLKGFFFGSSLFF